MLKRILNYIKKDLTKTTRNNMIIYASLFPVILAIGLSLFLPSAQQLKVTISVDTSLEDSMIEKIQEFGYVEIYNDAEKVQKRVEKPDDVCGIIKENGEYVVLLEGNESGEAASIANALMNFILSDNNQTTYERINLDRKGSLMQEMSGALLLLSSVLIAGFIVGFNIVDEKETKSIKALSVSPLKLFDFILSHGLVCLITGIIFAIISSFILVGTTVNYLYLIISITASTSIGMLLGFLIGSLADNLISAIAVVKVIMLIFVGIPIGSVFVPDSFQWVFYPFPNYWAFQSYMNVFNNSQQIMGLWSTVIITALSGLLALGIMVPVMKRKLKLR